MLVPFHFLQFRCDCCGRLAEGMPHYRLGELVCAACAAGRHDHPRLAEIA